MVMMAKKWYLAKTSKDYCNMSFVRDFDWKICFWYYFDDSRSIWMSHLWAHAFHQTLVGRNNTFVWLVNTFICLLRWFKVIVRIKKYKIRCVWTLHLLGFQNKRRHQKLEKHVQYRDLHVYRISMILVELITQIIEFDTDIFQKCVFQKRGWPSIFSKKHWNLGWPSVQGQAINWLNFWHNRRKFMISVTTIRIFIIALVVWQKKLQTMHC